MKKVATLSFLGAFSGVLMFLALGAFNLVGAKENIVIPAGTMGGSLYTAGTILSKVINDNVPEVSASTRSSGTTENILLLKGKEVKLALSSGMDYFVATKEKPKDSQDICSITVLPWFIDAMVVPKDSPAKTISDLKGKRINVFDKRTGAYSVNMHILDALGLKESDFNTSYLSSAASATAFQEGKIDGNMFLTSIPAPSLTRMATSGKGARLIPFTDEEIEKIITKYPFYSKRIIHPEDVPGLGLTKPSPFPSYWPEILVRCEVAEPLVYNITKAVAEHQKDLIAGWSSLKWTTPENAVKNTAFKLHPGAEKYYKEIGALK